MKLLPIYLAIIFEILLFFTGASIYSFLEVIVDRVPKKESFIKGRSYCDSCGHELKAIDLVPIFSWLFLGGKCRYCHEKIPAVLFIKELIGGASLSLITWQLTNYRGLTWDVFADVILIFVFGCVCNVTGSIYIKTKTISLASVISMAVCALFRFIFPWLEGYKKLTSGTHKVYFALIGAGIILVVSVVIWFLKDKMSLYEWLFLSLGGFVLGGFHASVATAIFIVCMAAVTIYYHQLKQPKKKGEYLPYVPFLCLAMHVASWSFVTIYAGF